MAKVVALLLSFLTLTICEKDLDDPTVDGDSSSDRHMEVCILNRKIGPPVASGLYIATSYTQRTAPTINRHVLEVSL